MKAKTPGVSFYKRTGKWKAEISRNGERTHIGYYESKNEAAEARALYEMDHPEPAKSKRAKPVLQTAAEVIASVGFGELPASTPAPKPVAKKPAARDPFELRYDRSKPLGPDNYDIQFIHSQIWDEIIRDGWCDKWLALGWWYRFHRYSKLEVWDAEVVRVSDLTGASKSAVHALMLRGERDALIANPALAETLEPAASLGVADLV